MWFLMNVFVESVFYENNKFILIVMKLCPIWTATGTTMDSDAAWERRCSENDVQSGTTMVSREIMGVPKYQEMRLQDLLHNEVHQPDVRVLREKERDD